MKGRSVREVIRLKSSVRFGLANRLGGFGLLAVLALAGHDSARGQAPPVPAAYQDLYTQMNGYLSSFNTTLNSVWNGSTYPVAVTATLGDANGNIGPSMLSTSNNYMMQIELQSLKAMGVQGVMVSVGFPMLYQPFLQSQNQDYAQYVSFYANMAASVRALGMKLIIENNVLQPPSTAGAGWDATAFFATLNWTQYQQARAQTAAVIAQTMQPDYLILAEEPDYETQFTGQSEVGIPSGAASMVSQMITAVQQTGLTGIQLGAGVGTWLYAYQGYIQSYIGLPLNFIDMHIYPINGDWLPVSLTIKSMAASVGLPVTMSECWLHKIRDSELSTLTVDQIRARDPFSFWGPLDVSFQQTMFNLANYTQMQFLNFFEPHYFWAYLPYDSSTQNLTPAQILDQANTAAGQSNLVAGHTPTGISFYHSLVASDTIAPSTPGNLGGSSGLPNGDSIHWTASTDNIGVSGYYVFRDGVQIATTAQLYYPDSGLSEATTYTYAVEAFDMAGNVSVSTPPIQVTTKDVTPPSVPKNLAGTAGSCYKVTLTWTASTDNVAVASYLVYGGSSASNLAQIGNPALTTFTNTSLAPATTYYYAIAAKDTSGNVSAMSPVITVTTPALPATPGQLSAVAVSASQINLTWAASTGGLPIANYHVFAGTSPSNLSQVSVVTGLSYSAHALNPATTYYYAVEAADTAGDYSPMSAAVLATTLADPTVPGSVTATAASGSQVNLTWSAATGALPVVSYRIYTGSSPANLTKLTTVSTLTYSNRSLAPSTTYYYAVQALDSAGDASAMSTIVSATTMALPSTPANLTATAASASQINLAWSASTAGLPLSYRIYMGTSPSNLTKVTTVTTLTYSNHALTPTTTYYYAVQAVDSGSDVSGMSAVASATTLALPTAVSNLAAASVSKTNVKLTWTASTGSLPITWYHIYRGSSPTNLTSHGSIAAPQTFYNDPSVAAGTTYYYAIQTADSGGDQSPMSAVLQVTTPN